MKVSSRFAFFPRQLAVLVPCICTLSIGCGSPSTTPSSARAASLTAQQMAADGPIATSNSEAAVRADEQVRALLTSLVKERDDARAASERAAGAEFERIVKLGGTRAVLQQELVTLRKELVTATSNRRAGLDVRIATIRPWLDQRICGTRPVIFEARTYGLDPYTLASDSGIVISGCGFGDWQAGNTIRLTIAQQVEPLEFDISSAQWRDSEISAVLKRYTGLFDQPARLVIRRADGLESEPVEVSFRAWRKYDLLAARPGIDAMTAECADTTNYDRCYSVFKDEAFKDVLFTFVADHFSDCCFNGVSGVDRWNITLKNGWQLNRVEQLTFYGTNPCNAYFSNKPGTVQVPAKFFQEGAATTTFDVNWWVDANCSHAHYRGTIVIWGPAGIPYV